MGRLKYAAPASKPNDYITLKAEMDVIIAFSACPNDKLEVRSRPRPAHSLLVLAKNIVMYSPPGRAWSLMAADSRLNQRL